MRLSCVARPRLFVLPALFAFAAACSRDRGVHATDEDWLPDASTSPDDFPKATTSSRVLAFLDASHAPSAPLKTNGDDCLKTLGCPGVDPIPDCGQPHPTISLARVTTDFAPWVDRRISVRAPLQLLSQRTTAVYCKCCNSVSGAVGLKEKLGSIQLWNVSMPRRFDCSGDDSALCCGIDHDDGDVIATGVLRKIPDELATAHLLPSFWVLDDVEVCRPRS